MSDELKKLDTEVSEGLWGILEKYMPLKERLDEKIVDNIPIFSVDITSSLTAKLVFLTDLTYVIQLYEGERLRYGGKIGSVQDILNAPVWATKVLSENLHKIYDAYIVWYDILSGGISNEELQEILENASCSVLEFNGTAKRIN